MAKLFDISSEAIKAAEAATNFSYNVPESAVYDSKSRTSRWVENMTISSCTSEDTQLKDGTEVVQFVVKGKLTREGVNGDKPITGTFSVDPAALKRNQDGDKKLIMSQISVNRIRMLTAALGYELEEEGLPRQLLGELFPDKSSGDLSPAVNQRLAVKIAQSPRDKTAKEGDPNYNQKSVNIDAFMPAAD